MEELLKELEEVKQKLTKNKEKIAEIEKKIEEKKVETGRWKPEKGDEYWFISDVGYIHNSKWDNDNIDRERYLVGNYYRTKEECEFTREKLKVITELKEYEEPKNSVWDEKSVHYHIYYNYFIEKVDIGWAQMARQNEIYFESREKARQAIGAVGEERIKKYYLEVEEE
jgi:hypothetical protein